MSFGYNCCELEVCFGGDIFFVFRKHRILSIDHSDSMWLDYCVESFNPLSHLFIILSCKAMSSLRSSRLDVWWFY